MSTNLPAPTYEHVCHIINRPCLLWHVYGTVSLCNTTQLISVIYWPWPIQRIGRGCIGNGQ